MSILKLEARDTSRSGKQLRESGIVPAVFYGKNLDKTLSVQLTEKEASKFMKAHGVGSQVDLDLEGETYSAMVKEVKLTAFYNKLEHVDFQALTAGESIKLNVHIQLLGKESVASGGIINELVSELELECLPKDLIEHVDVDLSGLAIGDSIKLADLAIASDERFTLHLPLDTDLVQIAAPKAEKSPEEDEDGLVTEPVSADVPVIGADEA